LTPIADTPRVCATTLQATTLANQLGGEHAERPRILFGMLKHRTDAQKVRPLPARADDAEETIDRSSPIGDQR